MPLPLLPIFGGAMGALFLSEAVEDRAQSSPSPAKTAGTIGFALGAFGVVIAIVVVLVFARRRS